MILFSVPCLFEVYEQKSRSWRSLRTNRYRTHRQCCYTWGKLNLHNSALYWLFKDYGFWLYAGKVITTSLRKLICKYNFSKLVVLSFDYKFTIIFSSYVYLIQKKKYFGSLLLQCLFCTRILWADFREISIAYIPYYLVMD